MQSTDLTTLSDVQEYAAFKGFFDASNAKSLCLPQFTGMPSQLTVELNEIYALAFEFERESQLFFRTEVRERNAFVLKWDDLTGWGMLSFIERGHPIRVGFSYHDLTDPEAEIIEGKECRVTYTHDEKINLLKITL